MNNKEKNQAIFKAMCEIATKFLNSAKDTQELREAAEKKPTLTYDDLNKAESRFGTPLFERIVFEKYGDPDDFPLETVRVENFSCTFKINSLLDIMKEFGKAKDFTFSCETEISGKHVANAAIDLSDEGCKLLVNNVEKDGWHESLQHVCLEVCRRTGTVNIVATDSHVLQVITSDDESMGKDYDTSDTMQALFSVEDWKRICSHSKTTKSPVRFALYQRGENELQDTFLAVVGDVSARSKVLNCKFPNWRSVLPSKEGMNHFAVHEDDRKSLRQWIKKFKSLTESGAINISFYEGSDLVYFDHIDIDHNVSISKTFRLAEPASTTIGVCVPHSQLKKAAKISGFYISDPYRGFLIDDENMSETLMMPMMSDNTDNGAIKQEERMAAACVA